MYPTVEDFQAYCTQIRMKDHVNEKNQFVVQVSVNQEDSTSLEQDDFPQASETKSDAEEVILPVSLETEQEEDSDDIDNLRATWTEHHSDSMCRDRIDILVSVPAPR